MISISLVNFQSKANCSCQLYTSIESFLEISYKFTGGKTYGFVSDFAFGGWGLSTCIGGRIGGRHPNYYTGNIFLNDKKICGSELINYSCFVGENIFTSCMYKNITTKKALEWALNKSKSNYNVLEIKERFKLTDERFDRKLKVVGIEIWRISVAIGFALNRKIFCVPWLGRRDENIIGYLEDSINFLKENGAIILLPSDQEPRLREICDNLLIFSEGSIDFE